MINLKKVINSTLAYLIAAIFIYNCNSIWTTVTAYGRFINLFYIALVILSGIYILLSIETANKIIISKVASISILFLIYILFFVLFSPNKSATIKLSILAFLFIWIIGLNSQEIPEILLKYKSLMLIIAAFSLFFWIFGSVLHLISPSGAVLSNWSAFNGIALPVSSYHNFYFEAQNLNTSIANLTRNTAIFTEAPMASLNFSLALLVEIFIPYKQISHRKKVVKNIIFILSILTTFSTTGYILLLLVLLSRFLMSKKRSRFNGLIMILLPITVILITLIAFILLNEKLNFDSGSSSIRLDDYKVGFSAWLDHPIWGLGINSTYLLKQYMGNWRTFNTGFSNSLMDLLSGGGLYLTIGYIFCFIRGIFASVKLRNWDKLLFILFVIYLFVLTIFTYSYILIFMLIWFAFSTNTSFSTDDIS